MPKKPTVQRQSRWTVIFGFLLDFGVYLFIFAGIFLARYIEDFKAAAVMSFADWTWHRTVFGMLIAFMIVGGVDLGGGIGKRRWRRWLARASLAMSQGFMWETIIG